MRRRPLIAPEALRQLPDGHALLLYGRLAPVQVRLPDVVRRPPAAQARFCDALMSWPGHNSGDAGPEDRHREDSSRDDDALPVGR